MPSYFSVRLVYLIEFSMTPLIALVYSFLFGLLHGILPDEHTWPITLSYAIGSASGKEGMKAGLYFSAAFTLQRAFISELAYLALAPFLLSTTINGIVYIVVGLAMSVAGAIVLRRNRYPHFHLVGHHHAHIQEMETSKQVFAGNHEETAGPVTAPPVRWTIIHGFVAGFGFGGFSLFINTVAAPVMPSPWLGFLPGLIYGLGTMIVLVVIGSLVGASLQRSRNFTEQEIRWIGAHTAGRALFYGGILFGVFGIITLLGLDHYFPLDPGYLLIGLFLIIIAVPALIYSIKETLAVRKKSRDKSDGISSIFSDPLSQK